MSTQSRWAMMELVSTVVLPTVALIWLTDADRLGPVVGLVVALIPPVVWSVVSMVRERQISTLAVIALVSVLLTGGVGVFELDPSWFALKEALVPALLGVAVMASASTRFALVPTLLERILDWDKVDVALSEQGTSTAFGARSRAATVWTGAVMASSSALTWGLARGMVRSPSGTEAFADELGTYTLVSFPALLVPTTLCMMWVLRRLVADLEDATGQDLDAFLHPEAEPG